MEIKKCTCGCMDSFRTYVNADHNPSALENRRRIPEYFAEPKPGLPSRDFIRDLAAEPNGKQLLRRILRPVPEERAA
jgi:hypothetical protein